MNLTHGTSKVRSDRGSSSSSLSAYLFQLHWDRHFPLALSTDETIRCVSGSEASEFLTANITSIFGEAGADMAKRSLSKQRYYEIAADQFGFFAGERMVGLFIGTATDWETYYFRFCALLPEYRAGDRASTLVSHLISVLEGQGIRKIETDCSPDNQGSIRSALRQGFVPSALFLHDQLGALVRYVKYLQPERKERFRERFCAGGSSVLREAVRNA